MTMQADSNCPNRKSDKQMIGEMPNSMSETASPFEGPPDAVAHSFLENCHPKIGAIFDYWKSIHPDNGLPGRQHFDPVDIPGLLSNVWLIDVSHGPLRFRCRLFGTRIVDYAGEDNTGKWIDERWPEFDVMVLRNVVELKQASWSRGLSAFRPDKKYFELERVRLPLASDGHLVDMILLLTVFFDKSGTEII